MKLDVIQRTDRHTTLLITAGSPGDLARVSVMSGETLSRTDTTLTIRMMPNDSLLINGLVILWWNQEEGVFVRQ